MSARRTQLAVVDKARRKRRKCLGCGRRRLVSGGHPFSWGGLCRECLLGPSDNHEVAVCPPPEEEQ